MLTDNPRGELLDSALRVLIRTERARSWPSMSPEERCSWQASVRWDGTPRMLRELGFAECSEDVPVVAGKTEETSVSAG